MFMFYHQPVNLIPVHPYEIRNEVPFFWNAKHRGRDHLRHRAGDFSRPLWHAQLSHGRGQHMWKQGAKPHRTPMGRWGWRAPRVTNGIFTIFMGYSHVCCNVKPFGDQTWLGNPWTKWRSKFFRESMGDFPARHVWLDVFYHGFS